MTKTTKTPSLTEILEEAENLIDSIYESLDAPDLTEEQEVSLLRDLKLVVQRRDMVAATLKAVGQ